jgi:hypothetical protein
LNVVVACDRYDNHLSKHSVFEAAATIVQALSPHAAQLKRSLNVANILKTVMRGRLH